ncbi:hypothetical protein IGI49_003735 [Enterococcus sp. AZ071]
MLVSWILCGIFLVLFVSSVLLIQLYRWDVRKMTKQLEEIIAELGTNEHLRTNSRNQELNLFAKQVNNLITQFKQEQQHEQQQSRKLKQEITNISHDLRTPLTSIKGFSDLLRDENLSETERSAYLTIIQQKIDDLTNTVDLFYELSCLESSDQPVQLEVLSLEEILIPTLLTFHQELERRQLEIQIDETNLMELIKGDKKTIERIFINLLQNILRYAESYVQLSIQKNSGFLILQVKNDTDQPHLIDMDRVFERTYTADTSRKNGQSGLGLYIVRLLAEKQGGKAQAFLENNSFVLEIYFPRK